MDNPNEVDNWKNLGNGVLQRYVDSKNFPDNWVKKRINSGGTNKHEDTVFDLNI